MIKIRNKNEIRKWKKLIKKMPKIRYKQIIDKKADAKKEYT
jgi:hypothetical protein